MTFTSKIGLLSTHGKSILLVVMGFVIIFYLSIFAAISTNQYLFAAILLYILASIFIVLSRNSIKYYLLIPIPSLGLWMISITFLLSFEFPIFYSSIIVSIFSVSLPVFCHFFPEKDLLLAEFQWRLSADLQLELFHFSFLCLPFFFYHLLRLNLMFLQSQCILELFQLHI